MVPQRQEDLKEPWRRGVAVDVGEDEVEGAGNAAFFGAALEAVEDAGEAEGGDEVGLGEFDEVECVGEGFAAFEG